MSSHSNEKKEVEEEKWLELNEDYYSLAFYAFYIDEEEHEEKKIIG